MQIRFSFPLPMPDGDSPPTEFRIWKWGENKTLKGTVVLDQASAAEVMAAYDEHGVELAIDYEHQTFNAEENGKPAPAAGWFKPAIREDGLWATAVRWTDEAAEFLKARQYRYFSPVAALDAKTRKPVRLMPMALTNWPATKNLEPLVATATETTTENRMKTVLVALGLKAEADETEAFAAVNALREFERDTMGALGAKTLSEAASLLIALKAKAEAGDAAIAELATLKETTVKAEIKSLIDAAIVAGVAPAKREELEKHAAKYGVEALKFSLSMLPKAPPSALPPADGGASAAATSGLSAEELAVLKGTGLTVEKYLEHKAAYRRGFQKGEE